MLKVVSRPVGYQAADEDDDDAGVEILEEDVMIVGQTQPSPATTSAAPASATAPSAKKRPAPEEADRERGLGKHTNGPPKKSKIS